MALPAHSVHRNHTCSWPIWFTPSQNEQGSESHSVHQPDIRSLRSPSRLLFGQPLAMGPAHATSQPASASVLPEPVPFTTSAFARHSVAGVLAPTARRAAVTGPQPTVLASQLWPSQPHSVTSSDHSMPAVSAAVGPAPVHVSSMFGPQATFSEPQPFVGQLPVGFSRFVVVLSNCVNLVCV